LFGHFDALCPDRPQLKQEPPNPKLLLRIIKKRYHICLLKLVWINCPNQQPHKPAKDKKQNREKKRGNERKKIHNLALTHIMYAPHKACNFRFTKSKGRGEKSKQRRVKGRERDMQRRGRGAKGREGYAEKGRPMAKSDFRVRKCCIYTFFLRAGWLNRFDSVRFNRFQTLETETEPNRNFFVSF